MKAYSKKNQPNQQLTLIAGVISALLSNTPVYAIEESSIVQLEALVNGPVPLDINESGIISGLSLDHEIIERAVIWNTNGQIEQLASDTARDSNDFASAVNESGYAVGEKSSRPTLWINGLDTTLQGRSGYAKDINDDGLIVGASYGKAAVWQDLQLSLLEKTKSVANAVNSFGNIVGSGQDSKPLLWSDGNVTILGTLSGFESIASAMDINDAGKIVGLSSVDAREARAVVWQDGLVASLGTLGGNYSRAIKINNQDQIIGIASDSNEERHAFIWQNDVMYDLSPALNMNCNQGDFCSSGARGINDAGQVVANVFDSTGSRAYVITIDENILTTLPSVYAPLAFEAPIGATEPTPIGSGADQEADLKIYHNQGPAIYYSTETQEFRYNEVISNTGFNQANNVRSTFTVSGPIESISAIHSSCHYEINGEYPNRTVTVDCQIGNLSAGDITGYYIDLIARKEIKETPRKGKGKGQKVTYEYLDINLIASATVESDTFDPNISNNTDTY